MNILWTRFKNRSKIFCFPRWILKWFIFNILGASMRFIRFRFFLCFNLYHLFFRLYSRLCCDWNWTILLSRIGFLLFQFFKRLLMIFKWLFEFVRVKLVKKCLVLHKLNLQVLVCLIVVCNQVVDTFEQSSHSFCIVFFFQNKLSFGEHLNEVH